VPGRNPGIRRNGIKTHRSVALKARDVRTKHGIRLTSPSRTVLEVAREPSDEELELLVATAHVKRLASERELRAVLARYPTHAGAGRLKAAMAIDGGPAFTRSRGERRMLKLLRAAKLPIPGVNAKFHGYEVDFLWREQRLAVEVDGYDFHSDRSAFERDRARDATLVAAGFRVIRVTARQLRDEPLLVIGRIAQALGGYDRSYRLPRP
jgi:very-short-patch-repair endonuclease